MKILRLSNKFFFLFYCLLFIILKNYVYANEPVDIWELKDEESVEKDLIDDTGDIKISTEIINLDNNNLSNTIMVEDDSSLSKIDLIGLYDPKENNLNINMWSYSDGDQVSAILKKINTMKLSEDSNYILKIALLTNSYHPKNNMSLSKFNDFKINYLIKNNDLDLIKDFLKKNKALKSNTKIIRKYLDNFLINGEIETACSLFDNLKLVYSDDYIDKFKIYCLISDSRREEAQMYYDLKKELNFKDNFFEEKFNILMGYDKKNKKKISQSSVLDFHLSQITDEQFSYTPNEKTPKFIWKYLSVYNLLEGTNNIDLENFEKVQTIEKATHEKNYEEEELLSLYKRYDFTFEQLLSVKEIYKILPNHKARAILYQRLLLTYDVREKLDLAQKIKNLMIDDGIENAFKTELSKILVKIDINDVPPEYTTFYEDNIFLSSDLKKKIKFNNKIIHQSKLLNYFLKDYDKIRTTKDTNDMLKKIKSNKKYVFSNKDKILIDSFKYDGIIIKKQYLNLYEKNPNIPTDLQVLINNNDLGMLLLRLVEIIGQDNVEDLGTETLYFITTVLNEVDMDKIRDKIIVKTLPLKI